MVSVVLVAGGKGTRMGGDLPKQFCSVLGKPLIHYSLEAFSKVPSVKEIVVVCDLVFRDQVASWEGQIPVHFADPGPRRQDSVYHGVLASRSDTELFCIHDAARPLATPPLIERVLEQARLHGAAVAGMPVRFTVKISDENGWVDHTPDRRYVWEIQTPQVVRRQLLLQGFAQAQKLEAAVTDDVSLVELLGEKVKLVEGSWDNIKVTTPEDWPVVEALLRHRNVP